VVAAQMVKVLPVGQEPVVATVVVVAAVVVTHM
jgi:hypothetical protein